jgi:hypothetical protein
MPFIQDFGARGEEPAKWYKVVLTIRHNNRCRRKEVTGLTNGYATAEQIVAATITSIKKFYPPAAKVEAGPVEFGEVFRCVLPLAGIYIDGRRVAD